MTPVAGYRFGNFTLLHELAMLEKAAMSNLLRSAYTERFGPAHFSMGIKHRLRTINALGVDG
jgi:hypothetical protein